MSVTSDILKLKKEKNAVILAHYYVDEDVQEVADYVGDSFYLSKVATKVDQDIIVFAGVELLCRFLWYIFPLNCYFAYAYLLITQLRRFFLTKKGASSSMKLLFCKITPTQSTF